MKSNQVDYGVENDLPEGIKGIFKSLPKEMKTMEVVEDMLNELFSKGKNEEDNEEFWNFSIDIQEESKLSEKIITIRNNNELDDLLRIINKLTQNKKITNQISTQEAMKICDEYHQIIRGELFYDINYLNVLTFSKYIPDISTDSLIRFLNQYRLEGSIMEF